jgi:aldehyde dehydrogenase (NAD+)
MLNINKHLIDGQWVVPGASGKAKTFELISPATEEVIGEVCLGSSEDVDRAVAAASRAFKTFSRSSREERNAVLKRISEAMRARHDDLAYAFSAEIGCPMWLAQSSQFDMPMGHLEAAITLLETYEFEHLMGHTLIRKEPIGVCGFITPWNWPLLAIITKLAPALATGCTVVWKPSEHASLSAQVFGEVLQAADLPGGIVNIVFGSGTEVGAAISSHPGVDMVSVTGSTRAGIEIARAAAATCKRVHQELGGKSPTVLLDDADVERAVRATVDYVLINAGQNCTAPTRLLVPRSRLAEVVAVAKAAAEARALGAPETDAFIGPVVNAQQWRHIQGLIERGIAEGAELVTGGAGRPDGFDKGYYVKPTVFSNVTNNMAIAREEIFGPVLSILPYDTVEEAVEIANDTPYGLAAYVYSASLDKAREVGQQVRAGQVYINGDLDLYDFRVPFGGRKMSGNGREFGAAGFEAFTEDVSYLGYAPENV